MTPSDQLQVNASAWQRGDHVAEYANRRLLPVEVVILVRYREALSGRTLEVGCGAGRILGYVAQLGGEAHGIDISPAMVEHCRSRYPAAHTRVGDLADVARSAEGPFDAVLALDNVLDVFDDAERRRVLTELRALLASDGLLVFSSHNLAYVDRGASEVDRAAAAERRSREGPSTMGEVASRPPSNVARAVARIPAAGATAGGWGRCSEAATGTRSSTTRPTTMRCCTTTSGATTRPGSCTRPAISCSSASTPTAAPSDLASRTRTPGCTTSRGPQPFEAA